MELLSLLADTAPDPILPPWASGVSVIAAILGGPTFAIWYAWYVTTRVMPDRQRAFTDEREAAEKRHADHVAAITRDSREDMKLAWDTNRANAEKTSAVLERLIERIDKSCRFSGPGSG